MKYLTGNAIHLGNFLRAIGVYLPYLVYSTFLSTHIPESRVGIAFAVASILAAMVVLETPTLFRKYRTYRVLIAFASIAALALLGLSLKLPTPLVLALFAVAWISGWVVSLALDVILEKIVGTKEEATGSARAIFLTASNIAVAIASLIIAGALTDGDYWRVFIIGAGAFLACAYISFRFLGPIQHVVQDNVKIGDAVVAIFKNPSLFSVMGAHFLMQLIFVWSAVYIPLYLHNHAGLPWSIIGIIYALSMLPFILLQMPVGFLADKKFGEKEFIFAGFVISALTFFAFLFAEGASVFILGLIVIGTHVGSAILEIATETYFFKKVGARDSEVISVFRALRQGATILGPLIGSLVLFFAPFEYAFAIFGVITLLGVPLSLTIQDTL
jgi:predicted MFS family arabinose efflux permease